MKEYILKYLREKELQFKEASSGQIVLETCPSCGDNKFHHFYMSVDSGLWDCKKCQAKGHFNQFRKFFGDTEVDISTFENQNKTVVKKKEYRNLNYTIPLQYASSLWASAEDIQKYLLETRKLEKSILERFKVGWSGNGISIPLYEDDKLVNIRYRRNPAQDGQEGAGAKYTQEKQCKPVLFNGDILNTPLHEVYITEGEFDAMQLIQRGFPNTVSVTLGAGYFKQDWANKFKNVKTVYLVYDTDKAGIEGAAKAAELIGLDKCKTVLLPLKEGRNKTDVTNYFVEDGYTKTDFERLVSASKSSRIVSNETVKHISEFTDPLREILIEGEHLGILTGYEQLDDVMGGARRGRLIVLSGLTNCGKSSYATNIALNMAKQKLPVFYFSLEMPPIDIVKKFLMLESKLSSDLLKKVEDPSETLDRVDEALGAFKGEDGMPIYLYNGSGTVKYDILAECARIVKEEYGCECIFVDHLHYFAHSQNNVQNETAAIVRKLKSLAMDLDIPIFLLAHLNRGGRTTKRKGLYIPALSDLRDSGTIEQDADQVLFVCRDSENEDVDERQKALIKVAKNRDGYAGRSVSMVFDESITTFVEVAGDVNYEVEIKEKEKEAKEEVVMEDVLF